MQTKELEKVIAIVQNGIDFATPRDIDIVQHFCEDVARDVGSEDPILKTAVTEVRRKGFRGGEIISIVDILQSWEKLEWTLGEYAEEIVERIVEFLSYWFQACKCTTA